MKIVMPYLVWWMGMDYELFCATLCTRSVLLIHSYTLCIVCGLDGGFPCDWGTFVYINPNLIYIDDLSWSPRTKIPENALIYTIPHTN